MKVASPRPVLFTTVNGSWATAADAGPAPLNSTTTASTATNTASAAAATPWRRPGDTRMLQLPSVRLAQVLCGPSGAAAAIESALCDVPVVLPRRRGPVKGGGHLKFSLRSHRIHSPLWT